MAGEKSLVTSGPVVFGQYCQKVECNVDMDIEVRIVFRPVQKTRTLRDLVPYHAVVGVLIPVEKVEFLSGPFVVALMQ